MKMNIPLILVIVLFGSLIIWSFIWYYDESYIDEAYDQACKDVGMTKGVYNQDGADYCLGKENHQAVFECEGFVWNKKCKANLI